MRILRVTGYQESTDKLSDRFLIITDDGTTYDVRNRSFLGIEPSAVFIWATRDEAMIKGNGDFLTHQTVPSSKLELLLLHGMTVEDVLTSDNTTDYNKL